MTLYDRVGRGLEWLVGPLLLLALVAPAFFVELWTQTTHFASQSLLILTLGWVMIALVAVARALQGRPALGAGAGSRTRWTLGLFVLWIAVTSVFAFNPTATWLYAGATLTYLLIGQTMLDWMEARPGRRRWILGGLAAVVGSQVVVGVLQRFHLPPPTLGEQVPIFTSGGFIVPGGTWLHELLRSLAIIAGDGVVIGTMGNFNYMAEYLVLAMPVLLGAALALRNGRLRWLAAGSVALPLFLLISTGARGALLGLLLGGIAALWLMFGREAFTPKRWWKDKRSRIALVAGLILMVGAAGAMGARYGDKLTALVQGTDASTITRLANWKVSALMILDRPITGTGLGGYKLLQPAKMEAAHPEGLDEVMASSRFLQAHNEPLQVAVELGLVGAVLLLLALLLWVREVRSNEALPVPLRLGLLWGMFALLVAGLFGFPFHIPMTALAIVLIASLGLSGRFAAIEAESSARWRPAYALAAVVVLGGTGVLVFQKVSWPIYQGYRFEKLGVQLTQADPLSASGEKVLALAERYQDFPSAAATERLKTLFLQGQYQETIDCYEANAKKGLGIDSLYWYARAHQQLGHVDEARAGFERLLRYYPEGTPYHRQAKRYHGRLGAEEGAPVLAPAS